MDAKGQQSKQYRDILKHKDRAYPILFGIISDLWLVISEGSILVYWWKKKHIET